MWGTLKIYRQEYLNIMMDGVSIPEGIAPGSLCILRFIVQDHKLYDEKDTLKTVLAVKSFVI